MSNIKVQQPVIHTPSFKEYKISGAELAKKYETLGVEMPFPRSDSWYYHSDAEGWAKVLADLAIKSNLYKEDRFDCPLPKELAFTFGLFMAEGYCNLRDDSGGNWKITNTNPSLLERCIKPLEREWPELFFEVQSYPSESAEKVTNLGTRKNGLNNLVAKVRRRNRYNPVRDPFIRDFRAMFYTDKAYKKVPGCILESPLETKRDFTLGAIEGDAYKAQHVMWTNGEAEKWGVVILMNDLGWNPRIIPSLKKNEAQGIHYTFIRKLDNFVLEYLENNLDFISYQTLADKFGVPNSRMQEILSRLQKSGNIICEKPWSQRRNAKFVKGNIPHCEDYALKAQVTCAERYGLNTLRYTYGKMPLGFHGFNSFWAGDRIMLFEPNEGFFDYLDGNLVFELGDNSYQPKAVLI